MQKPHFSQDFCRKYPIIREDKGVSAYNKLISRAKMPTKILNVEAMKTKILFLIIIPLLFCGACAQENKGSTEVGNPTPTTSPSEKITIGKLSEDGKSAISIPLTIFGATENDLEGATIIISVNGEVKHTVSPSPFFHESEQVVKFLLSWLAKDNQLSFEINKKDGTSETYSGTVSDTEDTIATLEEDPVASGRPYICMANKDAPEKGVYCWYLDENPLQAQKILEYGNIVESRGFAPCFKDQQNVLICIDSLLKPNKLPPVGNVKRVAGAKDFMCGVNYNNNYYCWDRIQYSAQEIPQVYSNTSILTASENNICTISSFREFYCIDENFNLTVRKNKSDVKVIGLSGASSNTHVCGHHETFNLFCVALNDLNGEKYTMVYSDLKRLSGAGKGICFEYGNKQFKCLDKDLGVYDVISLEESSYMAGTKTFMYSLNPVPGDVFAWEIQDFNIIDLPDNILPPQPVYAAQKIEGFSNVVYLRSFDDTLCALDVENNVNCADLTTNEVKPVSGLDL